MGALLWPILAAMTLGALALLLWPLLGGGGIARSRSEHDIEVYRDQLREIEAERERGLLGEAEAAAARLEVQRRMLRAAAETGGDGDSGGRGRLAWAGTVAVLLPAMAMGFYLWRGNPALPGQPLAEARHPAPADSPEGGEVAAMVARLEARLAEQPDDARGWQLLGRSYMVMERHDEAQEAWREAVARAPEDAAAHMGLAEAEVFAAQGTVTWNAQAGMRRVLELQPGHPGARYYLALARAQAGDMQAAFDGWQALLADSPADAPWLATVEARLREGAAALGLDPEAAVARRGAATASAPPSGAANPGPGPEEMAAAARMAPEERAEMIRGMVDRLAERLREQPDDADGWLRLGRAYGVLGEAERAADAYGRAAELRPGDAGILVAQGAALLAGAPQDGPLPADAEALFRQALALQPDEPEALWYVGIAEVQAGRPRVAVTHWQRLLAQLDPGSEEHEQVRQGIEAARARF